MWTSIYCQIGPIQLVNDDGVTLWGVALILGVGLAIYFLWEIILKKRGADGPVKHRIAEIINQVTEGDTSLTVAYAHWSTTEIIDLGYRTVTRRWFYAIGFNKERIVVVPLSISSKRPRQITYKNFFVVVPEMLGLVNGKYEGKQAGWAELYDKEGKELVSLMVQEAYVDTSVTREKVNIVQKEAAEKWKKEFVPYWMASVNAANGTRATGFHNNASKDDVLGQYENAQGGGKAKNM